MEIQDAQRVVCDAGKRLITNGLVGGTWGNISCRINADRMAITPSGMGYETLMAEDLAVVNFG